VITYAAYELQRFQLTSLIVMTKGLGKYISCELVEFINLFAEFLFRTRYTWRVCAELLELQLVVFEYFK